jgi:hypothetical protein
MTDPTAIAAAAAPQSAASAASATNTTGATGAQAPPTATQPAPAETRMFATLMQGAPASASAASTAPGAFGAVSTSFVEQWSNTRSFEDIRRSMLQSYDPSDPIKSMFEVTSNSMEAQMLFSKLHLSTSLASATSSLFGNLLKNQQ